MNQSSRRVGWKCGAADFADDRLQPESPQGWVRWGSAPRSGFGSKFDQYGPKVSCGVCSLILRTCRRYSASESKPEGPCVRFGFAEFRVGIGASTTAALSRKPICLSRDRTWTYKVMDPMVLAEKPWRCGSSVGCGSKWDSWRFGETGRVSDGWRQERILARRWCEDCRLCWDRVIVRPCS